MKTFVFCITLLSFSGVSAKAYVNPSFYLARKLAQIHKPMSEGRFKSRVTVYNGDKVEFAFTETVAVAENGKALIRISDESGNEVTVRERKKFNSDSKRPPTYDFLFVGEENVVFERLKELGLPMKTEAALYAEKSPNMAYVPESTIGFIPIEDKWYQYLGTSKNGARLLVDKKDALPVRLILPDGFANWRRPIEYRFARFTEIPLKDSRGALLFPGSVSVYRSGLLWIKIELVDSKVGPGASSLDLSAKKGSSGDISQNFLDDYFTLVR